MSEKRWSIGRELLRIFQTELPPGSWEDLTSSVNIYKRLAREYPMIGGHVHYDRLRNHEESFIWRHIRVDDPEWARERDKLQAFFEEFLQASETRDKGRLLFTGDDPECGDYALPAWALRSVITKLVRLPQAIVIVTPGWEWIFICRMTGSLDFGRRPESRPRLPTSWVDELDRSYSRMGIPNMIPYWEAQRTNFFQQIKRNLFKSDFTVIDLTDFPPNIQSEVSAYLSKLSANELAKIIRVGF